MTSTSIGSATETTTTGETSTTTSATLTDGASSTTGEPPDECDELTDGFDAAWIETEEQLAWFEGRTCVTGWVMISGMFPDLQPMASLEVFHGWLILGDLDLMLAQPDAPSGPLSLAGLESLAHVDGLAVLGTELTTLAGLEGLTEVGDRGLWIESPKLVDLAPLAGLQTIVGGLRIGSAREMDSLTSLEGLAGVSALGSSLSAGLSIRRVGVTTLAGLENLSSVAGVIDIGLNAELVDVDALAGVADAEAVAIYANASLPSCAAIALTETLPGDHPTRVMGNLDDGCALPGACAPLDAMANGPCEAVIHGVFWDGVTCSYGKSACGCAGPECPIVEAWEPMYDLHDLQACEQAFAGC